MTESSTDASTCLHGQAVDAEPVRIAVVGLGYWGPNLARNLQSSRLATLAVLCDSDRPRLEDVSRRFPGVESEQNFARVLADDSIEAVVIATRLATHYEYAAAALRAGKHAFVEKPLAKSSAESRELRQLADARSLVVMPGHTFLYSPSVLLVKDLLGRRALGDIYYISMSRVNLGIHQSDASVVWDLAPHDFSILRFWLDAVPHVSRGGRPRVRYARCA